MSDAGISNCISIFQAHSVRSVSTSKAATQGMSLSEILDRANWSKATTFKKFYFREVIPVPNGFESIVFMQ